MLQSLGSLPVAQVSNQVAASQLEAGGGDDDGQDAGLQQSKFAGQCGQRHICTSCAVGFAWADAARPGLGNGQRFGSAFRVQLVHRYRINAKEVATVGRAVVGVVFPAEFPLAVRCVLMV